MCIRDRTCQVSSTQDAPGTTAQIELPDNVAVRDGSLTWHCLLYTSDAADERSSVDLGGRRILKKKKESHICWTVI